MKFINFIVLLIFIQASSLRIYANYLLKDIEFFGTNREKEIILKHIPLCFGQSYDVTSLTESFNSSDCSNKLKNIFDAYFVNCELVFYPGKNEAYLVVDIVGPQDKNRLSFRPKPSANIDWNDSRLYDLNDKFLKRIFSLIKEGLNPKEDTSKGYLDFEDMDLHSMVAELIQIVPQNKANLIDIIKNDEDSNKRAIAANLLNWATQDLQSVIEEVIPFLDDEGSNVRNNLARFILYHVKDIKFAETRYQFIDYLLIQLNRPFHSDRNKAIYNLFFIAQNFDDCKIYIKNKGFDLIQYIAQKSVLDNVKTPAEKLIVLIR